METLWALLNPWKKPKKFKVDQDFRFYDFEESDLTGIEILTGKYAGILYYYTGAGITEEGLGARLKFGYQIVKPGQHDRKLLEDDADFVTIIGDILTEIILTETQIEPTRTLYSEESDF